MLGEGGQLVRVLQGDDELPGLHLWGLVGELRAGGELREDALEGLDVKPVDDEGPLRRGIVRP